MDCSPVGEERALGSQTKDKGISLAWAPWPHDLPYPTHHSISSNCPRYTLLETWAEGQSCWPDNGRVHSCPHLLSYCPPQSLHSRLTLPCPKSLSLLKLSPHLGGPPFSPLHRFLLRQAVPSPREGMYLVCNLHP